MTRSNNNINYNNPLQLDSTFFKNHINYNKKVIFNNKSINNIDNKVFSDYNVNDIYLYDGTEDNLNKKDRILLWKNYWLEYINSFINLTKVLPYSITTIYIGRHAIELGIKYLLLKKTNAIIKSHDLKELSNKLYLEYNIKDDYMKDIDTFCKLFSKYIEGGNVEYFRFPEYKSNKYFAGNILDIQWISYNFSLILLKLIHFAGLDDEI